MSESQDETEKKKKEDSAQQRKSEQSTNETQAAPEAQAAGPRAKPSAPRVGTPIGASRPQVGTPIGSKPASSSTAPAQAMTATSRPQVGTPVGTQRPTVGTPVGSAKPSTVGTPTAARPSVGAVVPPRPAVSAPSKPTKPVESKQEVSRRNFIRGLAVVGGIIAVGQFAALGPYFQGSVGTSPVSKQVINDSVTGKPIKTTGIAENGWTTFVYPRTGNPNVDNDTFRHAVVIHLPKGWVTTDTGYSTKDPISGDYFVALSRVCVHLWCLWNYVAGDHRGECPCHGSQYLPGGTPGSQGADNPGIAVAGPASLQTPPNNQLPIITLTIASDGTISANSIVGQVGCGQKC
ncbi:MAG: twin-arginine translocation signal domain-containing protein [Nitrososphaerales archaeon]